MAHRHARAHASPVNRVLGPQPPQPGAQPQPQPGYDPYDTSTDPTLQRIRALQAQAQANADSQAIQARDQLAIDYGDPSLALDDQTRAAASANPFSRAAKLAHERETQPKALDENLNKQNLYYSGHRGQHQSDLAKALLGEEASNRAGAQQGLSMIEQGRLGTMTDWQDRLAQAEQDASDRAQQRLGDLPVGQHPAAAPAHAAHPHSPINRAMQKPRRPHPYRPAYRP